MIIEVIKLSNLTFNLEKSRMKQDWIKNYLTNMKDVEVLICPCSFKNTKSVDFYFNFRENPQAGTITKFEGYNIAVEQPKTLSESFGLQELEKVSIHNSNISFKIGKDTLGFESTIENIDIFIREVKALFEVNNVKIVYALQ